jgi:DNA-binding transcriptional regulator YiaG
MPFRHYRAGLAYATLVLRKTAQKQCRKCAMAAREREASWQDKRAMSPGEFERTAATLGVSASAIGRFLGVSERTLRRYASGEAEVPVSVVLLLRAMLAHGLKPRVPPRRKRAVREPQLDANP